MIVPTLIISNLDEVDVCFEPPFEERNGATMTIRHTLVLGVKEIAKTVLSKREYNCIFKIKGATGYTLSEIVALLINWHLNKQAAQ